MHGHGLRRPGIMSAGCVSDSRFSVATVKLDTELLACPRCDTPLKDTATGHHCGACRLDFPKLGGLPWLFAEPDFALGEWRARANHAIQETATRAHSMELELDDESLGKKTKERLGLLRDAYTDQAAQLQKILSPLLKLDAPAARETYLALRTRLPLDQGLSTYYPNIFRDWCWGDAENYAASEIVGNKLPERSQRILVLGAGAGRLAYDLHQRRDSGETIALDFNPLLMLTAHAIAYGERIKLWEFPIAPRRLADCAIARELSAQPPRPGLSFMLADALRPPFLPASFDAVVTPWLVDILPVDFSLLAASINKLLKRNGRWINFGSLTFTHAQAAHCYSLEETLEVVEANGFSNPSYREDELPYMDSPASRHGRCEQVVTFTANKSGKAPTRKRHSALPEWLVTGKEPVPALREFQQQAASTRIYAFVMGMIDGQRSIRDMAKLMEQQKLMSREEAEASIRSFLIRMFDDAQGSSL